MSAESLPKKPVRSWRKRLLFSAVAVVGPLLLLELAARVWLWCFPSPTIGANVASGAIDTNLIHELHSDLDLDGSRNAARLYQPDANLFWTLRPGATLEPENIVYVMRDEPLRWKIGINADGHRGPAYPAQPQGPVIACLGDSCTFGYRVNDEETYPRQLERYVREHGLPDARVVNYGVPGYTTFQGRRRLEALLAVRRPDWIVIAFGANDHERDRISDAAKAAKITPLGVALARGLEHSAIARVASGLLLGTPADSDPAQGMDNLPQRVSPAEYAENLRAMVQAAKRSGAKVLVLDMVIFGPIFRDEIERVATDERVPWIDVRELLDATARDIAEGRRFQEDRDASERFWKEQVAGYRQVYYTQEHYRMMFRNARWKPLLRYLMIEPVHPNALGYRVVAARVGEEVVKALRSDKGTN